MTKAIIGLVSNLLLTWFVLWLCGESLQNKILALLIFIALIVADIYVTIIRFIVNVKA